jgi:hypothetical protein
MNQLSMRFAARAAALTLGALAAAAAQAVDYTWTSGNYNANGLPNPLLAGDTVLATGAAAKAFDTRLTLAGTLNWRSSARIDILSGASLQVDGLLDIGVDGSRFTLGGSATLENRGRIVKSAGSGAFDFSGFFTNRSGAVLDASSGTLRYTGGGLLEDGSVFQGLGQHLFEGSNTPSGTFNIGGSLVAPNNNLQLASGLFQAQSGRVATLDTNLLWTAGTLGGEWLNPTGRQLTAGAGGTKQIADRLSNAGRLQWASGNDLVFSLGGAELLNTGTLDFQFDTRVRAVNTGAIDNRGLLLKSGGSGDVLFDVPVFNRSGAVLEAASGTLRYRGGGRFEAGSALGGLGQHVFAGPNANSASFLFTDSLNAPLNNVVLASGIYSNAGAAPLRIDTDLAFSGGGIGGGWLNPAGRTFSVQPGLAKTITNVFTNQGTLRFATTDTLLLSGPSRLDNVGTLDFVADGLLAANNVGSVVNTGLIRKSGGLATAWISAPLVNQGAIEVLSGTLRLPDNWTNAGTLRGTATVRSSRLINTGIVAAGLPAGLQQISTLTFDGGLNNAATGFFDVDVAGGGLSDLLVVAGAVGFDGLMRVNPLAGYDPAIGDRFLVMSFASASGSLDGVLPADAGSGIAWRALYEPNALWIEVTAVPEPSPLFLLAAGLAWVTWRVRRSPETLRPSPDGTGGRQH